MPLISAALGFIWIEHALREWEMNEYLGEELCKNVATLLAHPVLRWRQYFHLPDEERKAGVFPFLAQRRALRHWSIVLAFMVTGLLAFFLSASLYFAGGNVQRLLPPWAFLAALSIALAPQVIFAIVFRRYRRAAIDQRHIYTLAERETLRLGGRRTDGPRPQ